ncbi:hypothetical protein FANTH_14118 [Fusarium anthophilum]|uniref:AMP-dependent synthetase/ligase domain-containing protein n=1 Tax=Fusarium anthophilum TaxID=48485 RepID=A0A8H5DN52_9HYPO|nr:hypothetical protein FANTH_14118 [Fusarium anthophilum]
MASSVLDVSSPRRTTVPISFTRGTCSRPSFSTVTEALFHYATTQPSATAGRDLSADPAVEISYGELAERSIRFAHRLRDLGVAPGHRVPLVVKRGVGMLVGILSILSCGAQYVPLDGDVVSDETLRFALQQTGGRMALSSKATAHRMSNTDVTDVVVIEDEDNSEKSVADFTPVSRPQDGCYVIYTSGTTGPPKGVDITHGNVTNLLCQAPGNLGIGPGTCVGQVMSISFDMVMRGSDWSKAFKQIDVLICTPSILSKYNPQDFPRLKIVATAGEPSSHQLADLWSSHVSYFNCYGPTETTIVNTMHRHQTGQPLSIGKPTPENNVYILDEFLVPVPVGEVGNIWAGGAGVALGYVDLPDKTIDRFRPDPFAQDGSNMYNTGDLCQWNPDGALRILCPMTANGKTDKRALRMEEMVEVYKPQPAVLRARMDSNASSAILLIVYRRLFSLVGLFNIATAIALLLTGVTREWMGIITAINLATAALIRQDFIINALYTITCANWGTLSIASQVISWILSATFVGMIGMAWPSVRKRYHDLFERTHRFVGWTMLALFWLQAVLSAHGSTPSGNTLEESCVKSPAFWLLAVATASVASSWCFLRKVPVEAEKLSDHAIRLHFDYTVPVNSSFTRLSHKPLKEWHSFATIPAPEAISGRSKGHSVIVSNAGDWTKSTIQTMQDGPTHIWTRGVLTFGVMRIATLFNRVVLIATGSGIGPVLGHMQNPTCPTQLIWSTKNPEETFGEEICQTIN